MFAASNFPFAFSVAGGDTASALAAGCSVVLKGHSGHPALSAATARVVVAALESVHAPQGLFALITGTEAGRLALEHPLVKAGAFTGSIPGGRALFDIASSRPEPIPFYGELGSVNPVFATVAGAAREGFVEGFVASFTAGSGQFCTKPGVLVVPRRAGVPARLAANVFPATAALLNPRIQEGYVRELRDLAGRAEIDRIVCDDDGWLADPPTPTLLRADIAAVLADPESLVAEVFGPTALVVEYDREEQLLELCAVLSGQLTVTVFAAESDAVAPALLDEAAQKAGRVLWNQWPTGVSVTYAQQHGGPYPATTAVGTTSVGAAAIERFVRPVAFQGVPDGLLPAELQEANPLGIGRRVDGVRVG
ncbi:aldehyde dehydrogenase family protein [Leucobacter coleopterorum]|uniref:aldehyde dehydrogenase family protein n=1 Tax=Leucobacter coleopterorum TaxID=2714933 RepID=UPI0031379C82